MGELVGHGGRAVRAGVAGGGGGVEAWFDHGPETRSHQQLPGVVQRTPAESRHKAQDAEASFRPRRCRWHRCSNQHAVVSSSGTPTAHATTLNLHTHEDSCWWFPGNTRQYLPSLRQNSAHDSLKTQTRSCAVPGRLISRTTRGSISGLSNSNVSAMGPE